MQSGLKILLFVVLTLNFQSIFSRDKENLMVKQSEFIFKSANKTKTPPHSSSKFTIALIGGNRDTKKLKEYFEEKLNYRQIKFRKVKLFIYRELSQTMGEDLIVFLPGIKLKADELESKLSKINYIILKESNPYGVMIFNGNNLLLKADNLKLEEENIEKEALLNDAGLIIGEQKDSIQNKNKILNKKTETIADQFSEISEKKGTIKFQKVIIVVGALFFVVISGLLFLLYRVDRQRKLSLIELEIKNKHIIDSLNYAKNIQDAILPDSKFFSTSFKEYFVLFEPKDIVSGDFYWTEEQGGKMYFAVADCTGHGVPGAFLSLVCSSALSKVIKEYDILEPAKILDAVSKELEIFFSKNMKKINDGMDITLIRFEESKNEFVFSGAHNSLIYFKKGELVSVAADRQPVGAYEYKKMFTQKIINGDDVDSLYLFSDGFPDQFGGPKNKKFSKKRFRNLLQDIQGLSMAEQHLKMKKEFLEWQNGNEQIDDVTVVGFKQ